MPRHSPIAIANEFVRRAGTNARLSSMQLQKLVYIAHGWNLAVTGTPLVAGRLEAWDNGPVFPELYRSTRHLARDADGLLLDADGTPAAAALDDGERELLAAVWDRYGNMPAERLSALTHEPDTPWTKAYLEHGRNATIPNDVIESHYLELGRAARTA